MKPKPYTRYIDFAVLLFSLDILHAVLSLGFWLVFGSSQEDPVISTIGPIASAMFWWLKVGLAVLFFKGVPFRVDIVGAPVAFTKIWTMSLFWPLMLVK